MAQHVFALRHRWDRVFYTGFVAAGWFAIFAGFAGSVQARMAGHADYPAPAILILHVIVFTAWMVVLTVQVALVGAGRVVLHRRLGVAGMVLLPLLVVTGLGAEVYSQRFFTPKYPENASFLIAPIVEMAIFAVCATLAFALRRDPASHKRLILMATSLILAAAFNRWWGQPIYQVMGDGFWGFAVRTFLGPNLLILAGVLFDWLTRGRVHRVYVIGVPVILAAQLAAAAIYKSAAWPAVARMLVGL